jgi:hypothetical protein
MVTDTSTTYYSFSSTIANKISTLKKLFIYDSSVSSVQRSFFAALKSWLPSITSGTTRNLRLCTETQTLSDEVGDSLLRLCLKFWSYPYL